MNIPEYVTVVEVKRVCQELGLSDWTALTEPRIQAEEARVILAALQVEGMTIAVEDFQQGLEVELEHGTMYKDANVTNNHPLLTGRIVLAHLKESLDYYKRLDVAEIEGDLLKAVVAGNATKVESLYKKLVKAKHVLSQDESARLR